MAGSLTTKKLSMQFIFVVKPLKLITTSKILKFLGYTVCNIILIQVKHTIILRMVNVIRKCAGKKPKLVELSCFVSRRVDIKEIIGKQQQSFSEKVKEVLSGHYI